MIILVIALAIQLEISQSKIQCHNQFVLISCTFFCQILFHFILMVKMIDMLMFHNKPM